MQLGNFPDRSMKQHNTEWLYYRIISDYTGHTPYEVYETMCKRFLMSVNAQNELCIIRPTSLNTQHHIFYMEQIRALVSEYGLILPDPISDIGKEYKLKKI